MNASLHSVPTTAAGWAARLGAPDVSREDRAAFETWLAEDPSHRAEFDHVKVVEALPMAFASNPAAVAHLLAEVEPKPRVAKSRTLWPWSIAAGAALVALTALIAQRYIDSNLQRVATRHGEQRSLTLPDGSLVQLNTDTQISYRVDGGGRYVELKSGEAFFDVAKDESRKFVVRTPTAEIQVVGTQFSVRTRPNNVEVIVKEGKVNVVRAESLLSLARLVPTAVGSTVALVPGERLRLAERTPPQVAAVDATRATAWRSGVLDIDAMTLEDVVAEVNRYVAMPFVIEDEAIRGLQLSGRFRLNDAENIRFMLRERLSVESVPREGLIALRAMKG